MMLIHVAAITNRLKFILDLIFNDLLKVEYKLTTDEQVFIESNLPKFSYGKLRINDILFFSSVSLLFEKDLHKQKIVFGKWESLPVFYETEKADLPFDIFAASFYLVSRYEEYLPHAKDRHDRFDSAEATAFKGRFLERPMVNLWVLEFQKILKDRFPDLNFPERVFSFTPTIDIDNAYAYKYKGWLRVTSSLADRLFSFEFKKFVNRINVHLGRRKDPYDSYDDQNKIHKKYGIKPMYFILMGDYGKYDKNISFKNKYQIGLVKSLHSHASIGLHPSYKSNSFLEQLEKEKKRLEKIIGDKIYRSRQHYLKLSIPGTYRNLIKIGIKEDYSMGHASKVGFRASICVPFYFFDIEEDCQTELKVYPFVAMDTTLKFYLKFRSKEVIPFLRPIVEEVKQVGGNFMFIFHNESIGNQRNWKNWGDIYEKVIKLANSEINFEKK